MKKDFPDDDNRVIAPMDVEGMRDSMFHVRRNRMKELREDAGVNIPEGAEGKDTKESVALTEKEQKLLTRGMWMAYLVTGLVFLGVFALFFLFCEFVWFR